MIIIQSLNDVIEVLIFMGLGVIWGVASIWLKAKVHDMGSYVRCKVWQDRNGDFYLMKILDKPVSSELVDLGDFQWHVNLNTDVEFYEKGHPVINLELNSSKPLLFVPRVDPKAPTSRGLNKVVKREWIKQWMTATKPIDLKAMTPFIIIAAIMGTAIGALLMSTWHPGLVQAAPPGYYYNLIPIPANATVVH